MLPRRADAVDALMHLVDVDPTDTSAVYALQRRIHPYFDACEFIHSTIEARAEADRIIEETFVDAEVTD